MSVLYYIESTTSKSKGGKGSLTKCQIGMLLRNFQNLGGNANCPTSSGLNALLN